jgi:peptidoglycan/xylan/chitin deacetylase (PgdA/CDA1 family)
MPTGTPTPIPTPKPLTFSEMNSLYGPCVYLPTFMYHHVQDGKVAAQKKQTALSVDTGYFQRQMQYLADKGYTVVSMNDLIGFFDSGTTLPKKSVLLTFDDAYDDFYFNVYPILRNFSFKGTLFTPTGLVGNPGYISWGQISDANSSGLVLFANHTWSHKNIKADSSVVDKEISTADTQLIERGLNNPKVFAYPYGIVGSYAEGVLAKLGYKLAFTTQPGSVLCKKQRLSLPRVRIGDMELSSYGL